MLADRVRMGAGEGARIYGIQIDETNSNPLTSVVYTDAAAGFTPASGGNGSFSWGSWENIIKKDFAIRPCVLVNNTGEVNYYLDYDNYTKKADGTASVLTGNDGDVMVEFGTPLWWKFERIDSILKIQLSNNEFDGAIKPAFEIEDGYNLVSIYPLFLMQILYLLMFKSLDSQTALGIGQIEAKPYPTMGETISKTFCFGSTSLYRNLKFLGVEDFWGGYNCWIAGCFYNSSRNILLGKENFNHSGYGYTNFGQASSVNLSGYITKVQGSNNTCFIPVAMGGNDATYYCDEGGLRASELPYFGGGVGESGGKYTGAFSLKSTPESTSSSSLTGRLSYSKDEKLYIGAYLGGRLESSAKPKLRSVALINPTASQSFSWFNSAAKNNN